MAGKKTADKAVGRTRGGLNTKIHAVVDGLGNPVEFLIRHMSDGQGRMEVSTITNGYIHEDASSLTLTPYAVKMPETSGKISNDYQPIGQAFTITLP